jgi:hypothetical protein
MFSTSFSQEEIEVYSHILAGLKPLVRGKLDAEVDGKWWAIFVWSTFTRCEVENHLF